MLNSNSRFIIAASYITVIVNNKNLTFKESAILPTIKAMVKGQVIKSVVDALADDTKETVNGMTNIKKVVKVIRKDAATDVEENENFSILVDACRYACYNTPRNKALALVAKYIVSGDKNVECDILEKALISMFDKEQMANAYFNVDEDEDDVDSFVDEDDNDEWNEENEETVEQEEYRFEIKRGILHVNNKAMVGTKLIDHVIESIERGVKSNNYINFLKKVLKNPRTDIKDELFQFLTSSNFPIAEDGDFYAYKKVRDNYTDCHTGTFNNSPAQIVKMDRSDVCTDREQTCSYGLHFASYQYAHDFQSGKLMIVKVNPADVVSIPCDYNNEKGRACEYKVICEVKNEDVDRFVNGTFEDLAKELKEIEAENDAKKDKGIGFRKF